MGLLKEFKEFLKIKNGKSFLTNELYIAELGSITVSESSDRQSQIASFYFDRYIIVQKATGEEVRKHLMKKYGDIFGEPNLFGINSRFERPDKTTYYKLITMNNKIMASATPSSILGNAETGKYEIIRRSRTLNGLIKNKFIRFADTIDLDNVKELEEAINNQQEFTM